jgi:hypothetical protein
MPLRRIPRPSDASGASATEPTGRDCRLGTVGCDPSLSDILQAVMTKRHEVLRSSEKITTEDALQFDRVQDLRSLIADKKINELSHGGFNKIQEFIAERLGIDIGLTEEERGLLTILVELRNIHTHNRGIDNSENY